MYVLAGTGAYETTNLPTLGSLGTNGTTPPPPTAYVQRTVQHSNMMSTALAAMGGFAGGMASTYFMRRHEDVGEERMKNLVKGSVIGGVASLALFLLFSGISGVATAAPAQPTAQPATPIYGGVLNV
jgi:branched-subunit amino acid ABC-type transport system permease component